MRFNQLERFRTGGVGSDMRLSIPLPRTPSGRVYRYSPNPAAEPRHFVLGETVEGFNVAEASRDRMKQEPRSPQTVCPYSGVIDEDAAFTHPADRDAALETVKHAAVADVQAAIGNVLRDAFRGSSHIRVESRAVVPRPRPTFQRRDLLRLLVCDHCGRDYGVYAIGLFCPDCGAPNLRLHFAREVELVGEQVELAEALAGENEELAYRLLGNAHEDVLTAFEATLKAVYAYAITTRPTGAPEVKPVRNDFQNLERGTLRFLELGLDPFAGLDADQRAALELNIQKRHVIGHNLGIVDAKFAEAAQDAKVGQTVQLVAGDIRLFAALGQSVVDRLDAWLADAPSPHISPVPAAPPAPAPAAPSILKGSRLSPLAQEVGCWLVRADPDGLAGPIDAEGFQAAFAERAAHTLEEGLAELSVDGYLKESRTLSRSLQRFLTTADLYVLFDPVALGTDPVGDARTLVAHILDGEGSIDVAALHAVTGWAKRRFNPAMQLVLGEVAPGHVSQTIDAEYATRWIHIGAEDRVRLRRFAIR